MVSSLHSTRKRYLTRWKAGSILSMTGEAVKRARYSALIVLFALLLTACLAQSVVVVGEAPVPPPSQVPTLAIRVSDGNGNPIAGAWADTRYGTESTDQEGVFRMRWEGEPVSVSVEAPGFFPGAIAVEEFQDDYVELALRPVVLRGAVMDRQGFGLPAASVSLGNTKVVTDDLGRFEITQASPGIIKVERPGWVGTDEDWDGEDLVKEIALDPRIIRALHIAYNVYQDPALWDELLTVAEETVVNAFVIDVKDESGHVLYNTGVELAHEIGAVSAMFDIDSVVEQMTERDLYKIARIVTFQDPIAARKVEEMAVYDTAAEGPYQKQNQYFLDPTEQQAREYGLSMAEDACRAGFDEIQFDYIRFPDGYPATAVFDLGDSEDIRIGAITSFLDEATDRLHPLGCLVGADIFGFITSVEGDGGIGQELNALSTTTDVLSPMVYPSHYSSGWFGFRVPNDHPGEVVGQALDAGLGRMEGQAVIRPWLQDFYYTPSQVREQIEAAEARSLGWMLWNAASRFELEALDPA